MGLCTCWLWEDGARVSGSSLCCHRTQIRGTASVKRVELPRVSLLPNPPPPSTAMARSLLRTTMMRLRTSSFPPSLLATFSPILPALSRQAPFRLASTPSTPPPESSRPQSRPEPRQQQQQQSSRSFPSQPRLLKRILHIRRVARVNSGGKVRSISALVVVGNGNGAAGYGEGRATDVSTAVQKATRIAERNMTYFDRFNHRTIFGDVDFYWHRVRLQLRSAPPGERQNWLILVLHSLLIYFRLWCCGQQPHPRNLPLYWHI